MSHYQPRDKAHKLKTDRLFIFQYYGIHSNVGWHPVNVHYNDLWSEWDSEWATTLDSEQGPAYGYHLVCEKNDTRDGNLKSLLTFSSGTTIAAPVSKAILVYIQSLGKFLATMNTQTARDPKSQNGNSTDNTDSIGSYLKGTWSKASFVLTRNGEGYWSQWTMTCQCQPSQQCIDRTANRFVSGEISRRPL